MGLERRLRRRLGAIDPLRGPTSWREAHAQGSDIAFEISAGNLALSRARVSCRISHEGTANRDGVTSRNSTAALRRSNFGTAKVRWGAAWALDGEVRARGIRIAVLAPALVSEGKAEGRGTYTMSGPNPPTLFETARIQGEFKIEQGVLGSFDLTRALQTGGAQSTGRTIFTELTGQALYDRFPSRSPMLLSAGAMNAGAVST